MARAFIEFAQDSETFQTETDQVVVTTRTVLREVQRDPRPPDVPYDVIKAIVAPRRSRAAFYVACWINLLVFLAGGAIWALALASHADRPELGGVGVGMLCAGFMASIALSAMNPQTCTCPDHMDILGCAWAADRQRR